MSLTPNTNSAEATPEVITRPAKPRTRQDMTEALHKFVQEEIVTTANVRKAFNLLVSVIDNKDISPAIRIKGVDTYLKWSLGSPVPTIQINNNRNMIFNAPETQADSRKILMEMLPKARAALAEQLARRDENIRKGAMQTAALAAGEQDAQVSSGLPQRTDTNQT